ncbi:MAG: hypothetical protein KF860_13625 [Cyclobacteriaceae bacterium]|nr:hypothetical protein [Cyclobacteriaceae bacterium]
MEKFVKRLLNTENPVVSSFCLLEDYFMQVDSIISPLQSSVSSLGIASCSLDNIYTQLETTARLLEDSANPLPSSVWRIETTKKP